MSNINKALEYAVEGGYDIKPYSCGGYMGTMTEDANKHVSNAYKWRNANILIDKNFWICLGKQQGWKDEYEHCLGGSHCIKGIKELHSPCEFIKEEADYIRYWHSFIDALSRDESIEEALGRLLDNK